MKKMIYRGLLAVLLLLTLSACGQTQGSAGESGDVEIQTEGDILIAYFTRLDNSETEDLDTLVQGGGPYGPLGDFFDPTEVDAYTSASIQVVDGAAQGTTATVAAYIQTQVGGDLFSIQSEGSYPADYDALIDQGREELESGLRPELTAQVTDMEHYEIVFLGFPNWWYDMPAPVYSFLESYDFIGKTVIPFVTSASSGFSDTIQTIRELLPGATVIEDGLSLRMNDVRGSESEVREWLLQLGFPLTDDQNQQE